METTLPRLRAVSTASTARMTTSCCGSPRTTRHAAPRSSSPRTSSSWACASPPSSSSWSARLPTAALWRSASSAKQSPRATSRSCSRASARPRCSASGRAPPAVARVLAAHHGPRLPAARLVRWDSTLEQLPDSNGGAERHVRALPRIPELTEYPTFNLTTEGQDYFVNKYSARFPFSWEAFLNDELNVLQQLPAQMAKWARDTEDVLTTGVLATSPARTRTSSSRRPTRRLQLRRSGPARQLRRLVHGCGSDGQPVADAGQPGKGDAVDRHAHDERPHRPGAAVRADRAAVAVPDRQRDRPGDHVHARHHGRRGQRNPHQRQLPDRGPLHGGRVAVAAADRPLGNLRHHLVPGARRWQHGARPGDRDRVPPWLRDPEVRAMGDTGQRVGGGEISPYQGSFSHDDIQYRVRTIIGAAGIDPSAVRSHSATVWVQPRPAADPPHRGPSPRPRRRSWKPRRTSTVRAAPPSSRHPVSRPVLFFPGAGRAV